MNRINDVFIKLEKATTIDEVKSLIQGFEKFKMHDDIYPQIQFKIEKNDIEALRGSIITNENLLSKNFNKDPLTNLLYAVLWKNGDLIKIKHIIEAAKKHQTSIASSFSWGI